MLMASVNLQKRTLTWWSVFFKRYLPPQFGSCLEGPLWDPIDPIFNGTAVLAGFLPTPLALSNGYIPFPLGFHLEIFRPNSGADLFAFNARGDVEMRNMACNSARVRYYCGFSWEASGRFSQASP